MTQMKQQNIRKQEGRLLGAMMTPMAASLIAPMASSLKQPVASSLINAITGKGQESWFLSLLKLPLIMKVLWKGVRRTGWKYNNMDHMGEKF